MPGGSEVSLAVDLGASSGRVVAGLFDSRILQLEEVHRFENGGVYAAGRQYWDLLRLWSEVKNGMRAAGRQYGNRVRSIGVDTWGVDFGLLGEDGLLLGNPFHYRDMHTAEMPDAAFSAVPRSDIFASTGLQFLPFNSLFQLLAMKRDSSSALSSAHRLLMMPDLFHWLMTGESSNEKTNASTTQCFDPRSGKWATDLLARFDLPVGIFGELMDAGTILGGLRSDVRDDTQLGETKVVLPGTHDTASAVLAVPADSHESRNWCYISSGTWSLMGVETDQPIINERVEALNFTNEGGVQGTTRLLKNIAGMWLIQECKRIWENAGRSYDWRQLVEMASQAQPLVSLIDPDHSDFLAPANMVEAIQDACRRTNQPVPESEGSMVRCALESLALRYRAVLGWLEELSGNRIETIHIVGGGSQNELLCQMAADACGRTVIAGPVEATAIGNAMMQLVARGQINSISEARQIIRDSFAVKRFDPQASDSWDGAFGRFESIVHQT